LGESVESASTFLVLVVVLVAATAFGLYRKRTDGVMKRVKRGTPVPLPDDAPPGELENPDDVSATASGPHGDISVADLGGPLGEHATLVQFSSAFCQPCRVTKRVLAEVTTMVDGVEHYEIDAESRLDLVRRLDIRRTPTVLVVNSRGHIIRRATGAPRKADVIAALGELI
jgi:thiol-disulfide isomerase/thioredoxin